MSLPELIYLANVIGSLNFLIDFVCILLIIYICWGLVNNAAVHLMDDYDGEDRLRKRIKLTVPVTVYVVFAVLSVLTPSDRVVYAMAGAHVVQNVANNERVQNISEDLLVLIEQKLEEQLEQPQQPEQTSEQPAAQ
jgi:hypothetical protein